MFLSAIQKNSEKNLFLKLAAIVSMAEGEIGLEPSNVSEYHGLSASGLVASINPSLFHGMVERALEKNNSSEQFDMFLFISEDEKIALKKYSTELGETVATGEDRDVSFEDNILENHDFRKRVASVSKLVTDFLSDDEETIKKVKALGKDDDNLSIAKVMPFVNDIRLKILSKLIAEVMPKSAESISLKNRKIMLFELVGMGYSDGSFTGVEITVIDKICQLFELDNQTIKEFSEIISKIVEATNEAITIINE